MEADGVAVFPADTVYGLACNASSPSAIRRMYELKGRDLNVPSAVMFFRLDAALEAVKGIGKKLESALRRLLPGPVTVIVPNPSGLFPLATGQSGLGIRVPRLEGALQPLEAVGRPVLQTSANSSGEREPRQVPDIPGSIRLGVDLLLDVGPLAGVPSTVVDLGTYESNGNWRLLREAAVPRDRIDDALSSVWSAS
jgi:L-threonylcarbamoyladenylate synthase